MRRLGFSDGTAEKPKRRHLREDVLREGLVAVAFGRARRDFFVGKVLRELADRELLWREGEVHRGEPIDLKRTDHGSDPQADRFIRSDGLPARSLAVPTV